MKKSALSGVLWSKELVAFVFLTIIARLPWLLVVPVAEAPDESTHAWVIHFCSENLRLPTLSDVNAAGPIAVYGPIPQFGYLPHILLLRLLPGMPQLITMRLGSLAMSLICVSVAYLVGKRIFLPNRLMSMALPLLLIFHPQFVLVGSYANNDITASALASLILLLLLETLERGPRFGRSLIMGLLLGWIALSKYSGCVLLPVASAFLLVSAWLHRSKMRSVALNLAALLTTASALAGAWFFRNYHEFDGDITGTRTLHYIWTSTYHRKFNSYHPPLEIILQSRWWRMNFFSFWGWFGYMTRSLPRPFYYGYLTFVILAFLGGVRQLVNGVNTWRERLLSAERSELIRPGIWLMFIVLSLLNLLTSLAASSSGIAGPQGRYLFISEIPLMALLLGGLANLPERLGRAMLWALLGFNLITYLYSSIFLWRVYL